ncbi:MAG: hypothetical protein MUF21_00660 [Gemmatimonadaceae bacterium]|nr:hypothetical protein [Gemmatimonadaceae bacterium]
MATLSPLGAQRPAGDTLVPLQEWTVPYEKSRPRDPAVAPDGRVWFVGQAGNYVARLDPASGRFERFAIDSGTYPHTVIVDARGNAWYAGNRNGMIGRIDGRTGAITRFPMPDSTVKDPHTMVLDARGDIWFTAQFSNAVGHLDTRSGRVQLWRMPVPNARPYGILLAADGQPWFNLFGTNALGTIDPATRALRTVTLPDARARGRRIARTSDGRIWYVDYARGFLGVHDPRAGTVREFEIPGKAQGLPYALAVDDRDRLWFVETGRQPNRFVGFDPATAQFFGITPVASGGGTIRHMSWDAARRVLWFGTDNNTLGRAEVSKVTPRVVQ